VEEKMNTIVRTQDEIDKQLNLAVEGIDEGSKYPGMSYEEGIQNMYDWLIGQIDDAPMDE